MDRYWLLTWTTYASWLPGDKRGFVSNVDDGTGHGVRHNTPRTDCDADVPGLRRYAETVMKGCPVLLTQEQAETLTDQFRQTAGYRGWELLAAAVMRNHVHLVVGVPGDPGPEVLLRDFKSYGSRALNRRWPRRVSGTWWTESGSRRKLGDGRAVSGAVRYVRDQFGALAVWLADHDEEGERGA